MMVVTHSSVLSQQQAPIPPSSDYLIGALAECNDADSISIVAPAGRSSGDLLILVLFQDAQRLLTVPTGWTQRHRVTQSFGSDRQIFVAERIADNSATDSPTMTHGTANDRALIVAFPSGATVLDSQCASYGSDSTPDSNDGTMSGGSGDFVIWGQTCQTNQTTISTYPTPSNDEVGPEINGTETIAIGVGELTASITTGEWTNTNSDHRYLTTTIAIEP